MRQIPFILSKKQVALLGMLFLGIFTSTETVSASDLTQADIIELTNDSRSIAGLPPLKQNALLTEAAQAKANDMFKSDYFAHTSPKGTTPWDWIKGSGYKFSFAGENLAINYTSAKKQHMAWMKSPTHKANILNKNYEEIGVAVKEGTLNGEKAIVTVSVFAKPRIGAAVTPPQSGESQISQKTAVIPQVKGTEQKEIPIVESKKQENVIPTLVSDGTPMSKSLPIKVSEDLNEKALFWENVSRATWLVLQMLIIALVAPFIFSSFHTSKESIKMHTKTKEDRLLANAEMHPFPPIQKLVYSMDIHCPKIA